ncbi:PIG-L family deacetylase [uncultured Oxalicibacterium sp.]|uniref:PIG-L deacetylase family protein n=1 Tax=uncultured Oxalicibacterium sp. TaxID=1168540 RepID=UPI0025F95AE8|nr:PIG-L family deacetylase [uncultured Oxalicibacterium sp.]
MTRTLWNFPAEPRPFDLRTLSLAESAMHPPVIVVLAPHPDDFDAIALTLKLFHDAGAEIHLAVLTTGASGVEDGFGDAINDGQKGALREIEQRDSCALFGLPAERITFMALPLDVSGNPPLDAANHERIRAYLAQRSPQLVFMPHGNDSNVTHQRTYALFRNVVLTQGWTMWAVLNQDAKTIKIRTDLYLPFDEEQAEWKAALLRQHRSQHQRNLNTRGKGFDERVLAVNRQAGSGVNAPYAEIFELERFG